MVILNPLSPLGNVSAANAKRVEYIEGTKGQLIVIPFPEFSRMDISIYLARNANQNIYMTPIPTNLPYTENTFIRHQWAYFYRFLSVNIAGAGYATLNKKYPLSILRDGNTFSAIYDLEGKIINIPPVSLDTSPTALHIFNADGGGWPSGSECNYRHYPLIVDGKENYIPCVDVDGKGGILDVNTNTIYKNQGSEEFIIGPPTI